MKRTVFFISDSTGITAQTLGQSVMAQFEHLEFKKVVIPYVNTIEKAEETVLRINQTFDNDGIQPLVFDTIVDKKIRTVLAESRGFLMDILSTFLAPLETLLQAESSYTVGKARGKTTDTNYRNRINAMHYAMDNDDGASTSRYEDADLILVGVSRCGKTPSSIYMALQFGIYTANYPITEEDLDELSLPKSLQAHRNKLFGLTIDPERLCVIRTERRANSRYSSQKQCEHEVREVEALFRRFGIPFVDTTHLSIEEIATKILSESGIERSGQY
jgi:hypothetical protein